MVRQQEFNIGDAVYTLHTDGNNHVYLKYQLVVGVDTRIRINYHGAHLSTDLAENIKAFIYQTMNIHTNDDGTFSLCSDDCVDSVEDYQIFENQDDAKNWLFEQIDNIQIRND